MLIRLQVTVPVCAVSLRLRSCLMTGSRGGVGPATQTRSSVKSSTSLKSAPPDPDRQVFGEVPIGAQGPHAQFGDRVVVVGSAELAQRNEHVRAGVIR